MLSTRQSRPARLPAVPSPTLDLTYSPEPLSSCSSSSSSSGHSSAPPSAYRSSESSGDSPGPFDDAERPQLRRKGSRPLPTIPKTPCSATTVTPPYSAASLGRSSVRRPLPRLPLHDKAMPSPPPDSGRRTPSLSRPLPTTPPIDRTSTITPSQALVKSPQPQKPNRHPFPSLSIRIDAPGRSTTQIILESPKGPISPIVFNRPFSLFAGTMEGIASSQEEFCTAENMALHKEDQVAQRLSELGFVEMEESPRCSSYSDSSDSSLGSDSTSSDSLSGAVTRPGTSMSLFSSHRIPPPRWDSHRQKHNGSSLSLRAADETTTCAEDNVIRIELVPATPVSGNHQRASRSSRMWVREKKGKRWVENDYLEILSLLRKL
ncbi:hypothetical protein BC835DRAFT_709037 [Cytidiella melzeri]|nr:hypothetical protein BC835DRAFT_709037 [Cytidiella melzeri]